VSRHLLAYIGESDCEAIGDGLLRQPVNAASSLAYVVAGIVAITWAGRADAEERIFRNMFGGLMIATGVGSVLYHGPQWAGSHFLHDLAFTATLWFIAAGNGTRALAMPLRTTLAAIAGGAMLLAAVLVIAPDATNAVTAVLLVVLAASDVVVHRTSGVAGRWYAVALATAAFSVASLILGRTGWPLCDPEGVAQSHAGWHLLSAVALFSYFMATVPARRARTEASV
jgi:predicted membrane channel-forming protein YqfA (hemolysin III family)